MLSRGHTLIAAICAGLPLWISSANAITNGVIDTEHPYVGTMAVQFSPGQSFHPCGGTLIAPRVFVVSAHCVFGLPPLHDANHPNYKVFVTFDDNFFAATTFVEADALYFDPGFPGNQNDTHDLGVIILSHDVTQWNGIPIEPAELPPTGLLDQLSAHGGLRGVSFENVGYGAEAFFKGGRPSVEFDGYRKVSTSPFMALTEAYLVQLMNSDATGEGGTCYQDSGGPKFVPDTDMIVAVQSQGDPHCRALSIAYRLDTPQARAFLGQFVELP